MPGDLTFEWADVEFLIVPDVNWQQFYSDWIGDWAGEAYEQVFLNIPAVVLDEAGDLIQDGLGIWTP